MKDEATRCTMEAVAENDRSSTEAGPPSTSKPTHRSSAKAEPPSTSKPTHRSSTEADPPSTSQPTHRSSTEADPPSTSKPTHRSSTKADPPSTSKPTHRSSAKAEPPSTSQPTHRSSTEAEPPSTSKPTHRSSAKAEPPSTSQPTHRSSTEADPPSTSQPTHRSSTEADPPSTSKPTHRSSTKADTPLTSQPTHRSSAKAEPPSTSQPKHKIFLSHSGAQKNFVENLYTDLLNHHRNPFLDIWSLPMAERFPEHIFNAAQQCRLAVVVVSEEYFTSKWPVMELVEFVRAKKSGQNPNLKILPLFLGLSVIEFSDQTRQEGWFRKWAEWAEEDPSRISVAEWKEALKEVKAFNGIQFDQDMRKLASFQKNVVRTICKLVSPDVKWYDAHVQGSSNICKEYRKQIKGIQPSRRYKVRVIGYYGVGGVGKTTMCKVLCNELALEFEEKVCHIELAPNPSSDLKLWHLHEVLKKLTRTSEEVLRDLDEGKCKDILCKRVSWEQPAFLALDNLWDDSLSIEHAKVFLHHAAFREGSIVMVTARTLTALKYLGIHKSQCFKVPELSRADARNLFLYHAAKEREHVDKGDIPMIDECVSRCYFRKSEKQGRHYLPLAVKVLGMHMGSLGSDPKQWLESLPRVRDFDLHSPEENPVFGVIRLNYDRLSPEEQALFIDIVCYHPYSNPHVKNDKYWTSLREWLGLVYRKKWEKVGVQLQRLKDKGLLEDVDVTSGEFSMHDLYREFANLEVQGKLESGSFQSRRFVYAYSHPSELEMMPSGGVWENLIRVGIEEKTKWDKDKAGGIMSLQGIQWKHCSNVVVLKLWGLEYLKGVLNLKGLNCLRSLDLRDLFALGGVEGLDDLNNLTNFQWNSNGGIRPRHLGQLPGSLMVLRVDRVGATVGRDVFARCTKLCNLKLEDIRAHDGIDFGQCSSLLTLDLTLIEGLQQLTGLRTECLQSLKIYNCADLRDASGFEHSVGLRELILGPKYASQKVPNLQKLTDLQTLEIADCGKITELRGLGSLRKLRELHCRYLRKLSELSSLSGMQQLRRLDLSGCDKLTGLEGVGDLPSLRHLNLWGCRSLVRLPELSKCTNLEDLYIWETGMELGEEDIVMLSKLPKLCPLKIGRCTRVDVVKRRVLKEEYNAGGAVKEERDLKMPPNIKLWDDKFGHRPWQLM
ncbi:hypothetical protein M758_9G067200 [Ceratodon purpureus]|nr:hypothetical protein M758_9G067200 [Ceratodon purpureus]